MIVNSFLKKITYANNILAGPTTAGGKHSQSVVTASVDGVKASANINVMNDLKLQSYLTYVGKSSMEVL